MSECDTADYSGYESNRYEEVEEFNEALNYGNTIEDDWDNSSNPPQTTSNEPSTNSINVDKWVDDTTNESSSYYDDENDESEIPTVDIATYQKSKRNKINDFEHGDPNKMEFHRYTPLKSPTVILTGSNDTCAGRNSIDRFCLATGLKATKLEGGGGKVELSLWDGYVDFQSLMSLQIKIPGIRELVEVEIAVFEDEKMRDLPIKFNLMIHFGDCEGKGDSLAMNSSGYLMDGAIIFPRLKVPKCGWAFDFYPFPSNGYDEGETKVFSKGMYGIPTRRKLEEWLDKGIVMIKEDDSERVIYGTTNINRIPKQKWPKGTGHEQNMQQIHFFDMEFFEWRNCIYSKIQEIRIKKGFYEISNTWDQPATDRTFSVPRKDPWNEREEIPYFI